MTTLVKNEVTCNENAAPMNNSHQNGINNDNRATAPNNLIIL